MPYDTDLRDATNNQISRTIKRFDTLKAISIWSGALLGLGIGVIPLSECRVHFLAALGGGVAILISFLLAGILIALAIDHCEVDAWEAERDRRLERLFGDPHA